MRSPGRTTAEELAEFGRAWSAFLGALARTRLGRFILRGGRRR